MVPRWVNNVIWWHVYPLGFTGAPIRTEPDRAPRLRQLLNWLDYAGDLGVNGLLLGPIFASSTHGYDTVDYFQIDPRLGTEAEFLELVAACRERGFRLGLDGVFNHVGREHPWVQDVLQRGSQSEGARMLRWDESAGFTYFEGHEALVTLRHDDPAVVDYLVRVMEYWLERGIDGWRLDAAYAVAPEVWAQVLTRVRANFPEAWFLGEVIHGDYAQFAQLSTVDSLTQYELWKAIWSSVVDRNYFELAAALERHNQFLGAELPQTFVGNHDVSRIASVVGEAGSILALTVLMTVGGVPSIYYGDEYAYQGWKREELGGDDDVRPVMPEFPADLGPLGREVYRQHQLLIGLRRNHPWLVRAQTEVVALSNEQIEYRVSGPDSESLTVTLSLSEPKSARVVDQRGQICFSFPG